jgi:putative membrane protein
MLTGSMPLTLDAVIALLLNGTVIGLLGIVLMILGFKAFDWVTPRIDVQKELAERNNTAVAIVVASVVIGLAILLSQVLR